MQDRFKFRYFDENKGMVEISLTNCYYTNLDYSKLMQCTGLRDKHGKLIYEGDLLRYPPKDKDKETNFVVCEVFFHNNDCCDTHIGFQMNRFCFHGNLCGIINFGMKYNFIPKNVEKMEVIGNKFQNKELLGEVE